MREHFPKIFSFRKFEKLLQKREKIRVSQGFIKNNLEKNEKRKTKTGDMN